MGNGTITMTGAEYDALASKIATLEAENAKLKGEYEWVASINTALDESNQSAWAENAKLRAELERDYGWLVNLELPEVQCNCPWNPDSHDKTCPVYLRDRLSDAQRAIAELREELDAAKEILAQQGRRNTELRAERDTLRQQLAERDATIGRLEAGIPRLQEQSHQTRQQRDKLAGLLRMVRQDGWYHPLEEHEIAQIDAALAEVK